MHYNKIRKSDISNGPGVRVSIFMQGCTFHCKGCFNEETWNFKDGLEFNDDVINHILELCDKEFISGLSILGGEPMHARNIDGTCKLAMAFKEKFPDKNIWVWSGFLFDDLKDKEALNYIDVLVDGRFDITLRDPRLNYCGSSNQRVIDVKKSIKSKKVVLYKDED